MLLRINGLEAESQLAAGSVVTQQLKLYVCIVFMNWYMLRWLLKWWIVHASFFTVSYAVTDAYCRIILYQTDDRAPARWRILNLLLERFLSLMCCVG